MLLPVSGATGSTWNASSYFMVADVANDEWQTWRKLYRILTLYPRHFGGRRADGGIY